MKKIKQIKIPKDLLLRELPEPVLEGYQKYVKLYYKAWELACQHIYYKKGLASPKYMDEALTSDIVWQWDTCSMCLYCCYAPHLFPGIESLDNFYETQRNDGYLSMAHRVNTGKDAFGERINPDMFKRVKEKIKTGQWEIVGGLYIEPDCNLISAESMIRQCLYGKKFFIKEFRKDIDNCWLPDVFGNSAIMPQILKKSGIKYFVNNKMSTWNDTNIFPHNNFIWKGIDGSEVYACVPHGHFISWLTPKHLLDSWRGFQEKSECGESLHMYGFGDGGSGVTAEMFEKAIRITNMPGLPECRIKKVKEYLEDTFNSQKKYDYFDGELYLEMHRGTYTSKAILKYWNRKIEFLIRECEILSTLAFIKNNLYPGNILRQCWEKIMINQFHDILPGTNIVPVEKDAIEYYEDVYKELNTLQEKFSIIAETNSNVVTIFNSFSWKRNSMVSRKIANNKIYKLADTKGKEVQYQLTTDINRNNIQLFYFEDMPGIGFKHYLKKTISFKKFSGLSSKQKKFESPFYIIKFNNKGEIVSLIDKGRNREIVEKNKSCNKIMLFEDKPGIYDAWDIIKTYEDKRWDIHKKSKIAFIDKGDIRSTLRVEVPFFNSKLIQHIHWYRYNRRIDFETKVEWHEHNKLLKVAFPVTTFSPKVYCDLSAGFIERPTTRNNSFEKAKFEVCAHKWVAIEEGDYGVAIMNDCKYGYDIKENVIRLTLLRGPIRPDPGSDQGTHYFAYSLFPYPGSLSKSGLIEESYDLNSPLNLLDNLKIKDKIPYIYLSPKNVKIEALKKAENNNDIIVRIIEQYGTRGEGVLYSNFNFTSAHECDLLERPSSKINSCGNELKFKYSPFEIKTLRLKV